MTKNKLKKNIKSSNSTNILDTNESISEYLLNKEIPFKKSEFPWAASGRAIAIGANQGKTKILFDPDTKQILGVAVVGPGAGDIISEGMLAMEMGSDAEDVSLTVHPHPTLGETFGMAAEVFEGTVTDLYIPKK